MSKFQRYTVSEMHLLLCDRQLSERFVASHKPGGTWIAEQALVCPYYVPLDGPLGVDWVRPKARRKWWERVMGGEDGE